MHPGVREQRLQNKPPATIRIQPSGNKRSRGWPIACGELMYLSVKISDEREAESIADVSFITQIYEAANAPVIGNSRSLVKEWCIPADDFVHMFKTVPKETFVRPEHWWQARAKLYTA